MLTPEDVVWEPYSPEAVATHAPAGLSSHCSTNASLCFLGAFTLHTTGIRPLCAYKYSEVCELPAALKHQSSLYTQCLEVGLAGRITMVLGKEKGEERETP